MRQKHTGADGEVKFVAHRNLYVGFMGGRVVCTKRTAEACHAYLSTQGAKPAAVKKAKPPKVTKMAQAVVQAAAKTAKAKRNISPDIKAQAAKFMAYRKKQESAFEPVQDAEVPDLFDEGNDSRWDRCENFDREYFSVQMAD